MPDRQDHWSPEPPEHTQPWGGWITHENQASKQQLIDLRNILLDVIEELDRRALMIEAEQKAHQESWGHLFKALLSNPALPYFGGLGVLLLAMWVSGDRKGALETVKSMLQK